MLGQQRCDELAVRSVVAVEMHVFLRAVEYLCIDGLAVGRPRNVGDIAFVVEIVDVEPSGISGSRIVYSDRNPFGIHAVHRILYLDERTRPRRDVEQRKGRNARFVLDIECQPRTVGRREQTAGDAEFVARNRRSANDVLVGIIGNLALGAVSRNPHDIVSAQFGMRFRRRFRRCGHSDFAFASRTDIDGITLAVLGGDILFRILPAPLYLIVLRDERTVENRILHSQQFPVGILCRNSEYGGGRHRRNRRQTVNLHQNRYFSVFTLFISEAMSRHASSPSVVPTTSITLPAVIAPIVPHWRSDSPSHRA